MFLLCRLCSTETGQFQLGLLHVGTQNKSIFTSDKPMPLDFRHPVQW